MARFKFSHRRGLLFLFLAVVLSLSACSGVSPGAGKQPSVEAIALCTTVDGSQQCQNPSQVFEPGAVVYCSVKVSDLEPDTVVKALWYRAGFEVSSYSLTVGQGGSGFVGFHLGPAETSPGDYRVEIFLNEGRAGAASFRVQGEAVAVQATGADGPASPAAATAEPTRPPKPVVEVTPPTVPPPPTATPVPTRAPTRPPKPVVEVTPPAAATPTSPPPPAEPTATTPPQPAGFGPPRGRIVYTVGIQDRKNYQVWIMNVDGSGKKLLAELGGEPTFSPDGKQIAFYAWEGKSGGNGLWLMNDDGTDQRVFLNDGEAAYPMWSPKGDTISYTSYRGGRSFDIYIKRLDDGQEWKVVDGKHQAWAPDASYLVVNSCVGPECGLYMVNVDGSGLRRFTNQPSDDFATWSPDGKHIVFCSERDGNWEIYVMNADGSNVQRLTNDPGHDVLPVWLPTSNHIVWRSTRGGAWAIWVMDRDGGSKTKITDVQSTQFWGWEKMDAGW